MKQFVIFILSLPILVLFFGCSSKEEEVSAADSAEVEQMAADFREEVQEFYKTKVSLPPELYESLEAGRVTQEEIDERIAAGEFPKFFQFKTIDDLPTDLVWENGSDMKEIGSPKAKKGGTAYSAIQDFPRTFRTVGPDANGSFRRLILDDAVLKIAHLQPNTKELGPNGQKFYPGLASEWAIDKESRTVYVRLDPKARWSDGEAVTTEDFQFMFFFYFSKYIRAPWYNNFHNRFFAGITSYDDHTFSIKITVDKPDFAFYALDMTPRPEHFFGEMGDDYTERYQWRFEPTTAAYIIKDEDVRKGESISFRRLEDWWAKDKVNWRYRYNYDKVFLKVVRDDSKAFEMFKNGELDAGNLTLSEKWYDKLPDDDPLVEGGYVKKAVFYNQRPRPPYGIWINTSKPLLDNKDIRTGIQYASNWQLVIDKYFRGDYDRLDHTAVGYGAFSHPTLKAREFSIEKALASFAKAGFTKRGPDGILVNADGKKLSFSLTTGYKNFKDPLTIIKEEAAKAGLEIRLQIMDGTAGFKVVQEKQHEMHFLAWGYAPEMYPRYWETFHSVNAYNKDGSIKVQTNNVNVLSNEKLDGLIEAYRKETDVDEMIKLAHEMEEVLHDEAVFVPAFVIPFYRVGYWKWRKYPDDFNVMLSGTSGEYALSWMDPEEKKAVLKAKSRGETFEKSIKIYDQYRSK